MSTQDTQSWNGGVRDEGCIPRASRGQFRTMGVCEHERAHMSRGAGQRDRGTDVGEDRHSGAEQ